MGNHSSRNRRDSITSRFRLRNYDYSTSGMYFVTICTEGRELRFGEVVNDHMVLTPAGEMVSARWRELPTSLGDVLIDSSVIMPNHIHAIIGIGLTNPDTPQTSMSKVVHWYKSITTTGYIRGVRAEGWPRFDGRLWQSGYHDHIIRDERDLNRIREYIESNPAFWPQDIFATNPS